MFCGNCGVRNADNARFCASCGKPVGAVAGAVPPAPSPPPRYAPPPPPQQQIPAQPQYAPPPSAPQFSAPQAQYGGAPPIAGAARPNVSAHLGLAIVTTILCCLPLGVIGIVYASQVKAKLAAGDYAGAAAASSKAKTFSILGIVLGGIAIVIYGITVAEQISKSM